MLCISCADQQGWAELISLMLLSSPFFSDTYRQETDHPGESQEACVSILLISTNTYKHTPLLSSPKQMTSAETKTPLRSYCYNQFPDEWKHLIIAADTEVIEVIVNAIIANKSPQLYSTSNFRLGLSTSLKARPTILHSSVLGYLSDPRPSRCCRSRTSKP